MTGPTPKRNGKPARPVALAVSACLAFAIVALGLIRMLPPPHSQYDYLIVGTLATMAALITTFAGLVLGRKR